ncbi:MAG: cation:proton antiporter [Candidatus Parvarchaeota archaeon]|nr:cation:proton antiporter [Candidatus Jingweiarchaeum tengchongense]MCW1298642.1 cation:proton antiporter [Candidatus Jingweiarchaeum tengchongense]MCW1300484.1 cation:proton antiporter [Candidatus Jingweiarchaeum tengchongense]MCW1304701.1 cation:proton antiporter [Candidatus Jingweiarchaeum tengchongense]MCW1305890.1 cation:proton antiporter [Candidatus Jingweiarchaeum tengchongense]
MIEEIFSIAILLFFAKILGEFFRRLDFSPIIGEILAGIILGPAVLNLVKNSQQLSILSNLGIVFLFFLIGLSTEIEEIEKNVFNAGVIVIFGDLLALIACFVCAVLLGFNYLSSFAIAVALIGSSTAISIRYLAEIGELHKRYAKTLITGNLIDDVFVTLLLSVLIAHITNTPLDIWQALTIVLAIIGFFFFVLKFGSFVSDPITDMIAKMKDEQALIAVLIAIMFFIAAISDRIEIAIVTGAFLAGAIFSNTKYTEQVIIPKIKTIGYALFIPVFFAYSGLSVNLIFLSSFLGVVYLIIFCFMRCFFEYIGIERMSRLFGFDEQEARGMGLGMLPLGEFTIVVAQISLANNIISNNIFSVLVMSVMVTTIATPIIFKLTYH